MTSQINPVFPVYGTPSTQTVRDNFAHAKAEIEALQAAVASGGSTLPTSSEGLKPGTWWNNEGFICVA